MRTSSHLPDHIRARMPVVCPPERQGMTRSAVAVGMACRALILFWAVFGLALFFFDAFKLTTAYPGGAVSPRMLAVMAAAAVAAFTAMKLWRAARIAGLAALAVGLPAAAYALPGGFWLTVFGTTWNACIARLTALGYGSVENWTLDLPQSTLEASTCIRVAAGALIVLLAAVYVPCLLGRTRLALPAVAGGVILVPVFTYNISRSNWGFVFIVAAYAAILVLAAYDRRYLRRPRDCDDRAQIFPPNPNRPKPLPLPAHMAERARGKAERAQKKAAPTADEEISHYLSAAPARSRRRLTADEKQAERAYKASLRAVRRYQAGQRQARIAAGGFAGVGMLLIAMLMLVIPARVTQESFTTVEAIDEPLTNARRYVTAFLMGDNPILDELGYGGNVSNFAPHTTDATQRRFTGEKIFEVETMYNTNLYLRGWVATEYRDGSWYTAEDEVLDTYRATFGTAFSAESMRTRFYRYVDPSVGLYTDYTKRYQSHTDRGFVTMQVNLRRMGGSANLVFMPSYYNPEIGVVAYASGEPSELTYVNFYDGIYTGRRYLPGAAYGAVVYATTMRDDTFMDTVSTEIAAYNLANSVMETWLAMDVQDKMQLGETSLYPVSDGVSLAVRYGETGYAGQIIRDDDPNGAVTGLATEIFTRYLNMTVAELDDLKYAWRVEDYYRAHVYENYTADVDSAIIERETLRAVESPQQRRLARTDAAFSTDPATYANRHAAVMAVLAYLSEETDSGQVDENGDPITIPTFTYTLEPTVEPNDSYDGVENFLAVTREGYCVQFASAAVLMLRELGIPARYVEGYIVTDFRRNLAAESAQRYSASVRDYNAHAWVEVYYDGIGWLNYEATPTYMADMYEEPQAKASTGTVRPWYVSDDDEAEEDPIDPDELARLEAEAAAREAMLRRITIAVTAAVILLVVMAIAVVVTVIVRRTRRADADRAKLLSAVRAGLPDGSPQAHAAARRLIDEVTAILAACGAAPATGEQREAYAERLSGDWGGLSPIPLCDLFAAIAAEEFGGGMDSEALRALGVFRAALGDAARSRMPCARRLVYRYIKHLL